MATLECADHVDQVTTMRNYCALLLVIATQAFAEPATKLAWTKKFGGSDFDQVRAMTTDAQGNLYIAGVTTSMDLPATGAFKTPRGTNLYRLTTSDIDARPLPATVAGTVLAITFGPGNSAVGFVATSSGMMRTDNGGTSWRTLPFPALPATPAGQIPLDSSVRSIAVDPRSPAIVYAAASSQGLMKSSDGGQTWVPVLTPDSGAAGITWVAVDPLAPSTVYASGYSAGGLRGYRSDDAGTNWINLPAPAGRITPDASKPGTIYGSTDSNLVRSQDRGASWTDLTAPPSCGYGLLVSDPVVPPNLYALCDGAMYRSRDQGQTWTALQVPADQYSNFVAVAADAALPLVYVENVDGRVFRSGNGGDSWTQVIGASLTAEPVIAAAGGSFYTGTSRDRDGFAAKLTPEGDLVWATYLGGSGWDTAEAIVLDSSGNVYVAGTTQSADFPVTAGSYNGGLSNGNGAFVSKLAPDGSKVVYSALLKVNGDVSGIGIDGDGNAIVGGLTRSPIVTTPGVVYPDPGEIPNGCPNPAPFYACPDLIIVSRGFLSKLSASGATLAYSTYLGDWGGNDQLRAVAVDGQGNAYAAGAILWKLDPSATRVLWATVLGGGWWFDAAVLDKDGSLLVGGPSGAELYTTPGVWKPWPDGSDGFLARYSTRGELLAATSMGAEVSSISPAPDGTVVIGGRLNSGSYYTKSMVQGPFANEWAARVSGDLSQLLFSSFFGQNPQNDSVLVAGLSENALVAVDSSFTGFPYADSPATDVYLYRAETADSPLPRIDAIRNEADPSPSPVSPNERVVIEGVGFGDTGTQVTIAGQPALIVDHRKSALTVVVPGSVVPGSPAAVVVTGAGGNSVPVPMPVANATPALYHVNPYPDQQGLVLNQDGTLNSPANPAAQGSIISVALNGIGAYTVSGSSIVPALPVSIFVYGQYAYGVDANLLPAPGLSGPVPFVKVYVPTLSWISTPTPLPLMAQINQQLTYDTAAQIWVK